MKDLKEVLREAYEDGLFIGICFSIVILSLVLFILSILLGFLYLGYTAVMGDAESVIWTGVIIFSVLFIIVTRLWALDLLPTFRKRSADWDEFMEWQKENDKANTIIKQTQ